VAVGELRSRLEHAVQSRLVADVPLGVFLSGGIDSSVVAALAARHGALDTFSIGFDEASFDEREYARSVARHIGSRHHEHVVRAGDMIDLVPRLGSLLDEPIGDASILPTSVLSRFAREYVTVALGGDGGDELFAGYPMHQGHRLAAPLRRRRAAAGDGRAPAAALPVSHRNFAFGFKAGDVPAGRRCTAAAEPRAVDDELRAGDARVVAARRSAARAGTADPFAVMHERWAESAGCAATGARCASRRDDVPAERHPRQGRPGEHGRGAGGTGAVPRPRRCRVRVRPAGYATGCAA
jgi:asparagine synthetase B (glutamine-hydrolysing)